MANLTRTQLKELLSTTKGTTIVTIETETDPRMRKTNNPYSGHIVKRSKVNGMIGWNYTNSVNNQRDREGNREEFVAKPRKWGQRIIGTPLVEHKESYYLELKVERAMGSTFVDVRTGNEVPKETLLEWLPKPSTSSRQDVEKEIILRDYKLDSIVKIRINKNEYQIVE